MPNVIRDAIVAIRVKRTMNTLSAVCAIAGWALLLWASWQVGLGLALIMAATALYVR